MAILEGEAVTAHRSLSSSWQLERRVSACSQVFSSEWIIAWFEVRFDALLAHESARQDAKPLFSILR